MEYITIKRFKRKGIDGRFNIPYGTELEARDGVIIAPDGRQVCLSRSYAAHEYFARNDDGNGLERGKLSHEIVEKLLPKPGETREQHNERWLKVWHNETAQKYRRKEHQSHWLWSDDFYNADIEDLKGLVENV